MTSLPLEATRMPIGLKIESHITGTMAQASPCFDRKGQNPPKFTVTLPSPT